MDLIILDRENNKLDLFSNKFFSKLEYMEKLNNVGSGNFEMTIENSNLKYGYLKENNRFIFVDNWKTLFWGFLYQVNPTYTENNKFYFKNLLWTFEDKLLYSDVTYTDKSIDFILNDVLSNVNAREDTNITIDCWITDVVTKTYVKWQTIYTIIDDLLTNKYEFTIKPVISEDDIDFIFVVKDTIGIDRTQVDNNYVEYKFELDKWGKRTINKISWNIDIRNTANAVIGVEDWTYEEQEDITSITEIWRIERKFKTSWDLTGETTAYLDERKNTINQISIDPIESDYCQVNIGDIVKIITSWNKFLEFNWGIKVIAKTFKMWDLIKVWIDLNNTKVRKIEFIDEINKLKTKVNNL